jgi:hypothetical protein
LPCHVGIHSVRSPLIDSNSKTCYYRGYVVSCTVVPGNSRGYRATVEIGREDARTPSRIKYSPHQVLFMEEQYATYFALQWAERRIDNLSASERLKLGDRKGSNARLRLQR